MKLQLIFSGFFLALGVNSAPALAHGVRLEQQTIDAVAVHAQYDNGDPMAKAQVLVYAPDQSEQPWLTGTTDGDGRFSFIPAGDRPGNWEVMVRQAGHGGMLVVAVGEVDAPDSTDETVESNAEPNVTSATVPQGELSPAQRWITMGAVIWGFIGTALFFSKGKSIDASS